MAVKSLTIRNLALQLLRCDNIDQPVSALNINDINDEFDEDEQKSKTLEIVSISDNSDQGGDAILYYLGDVPINEDE